jgi:hypothetical protein
MSYNKYKTSSCLRRISSYGLSSRTNISFFFINSSPYKSGIRNKIYRYICQSYITTNSQSASPSWCQAPIWDPRPIFLPPWNVLVILKRPLWREDGSVIYFCCWSLPAQSRSGPSPARLKTIFYCPSSCGSPNLEGQGGPDIPPCTGFPFRRLLRLAGLRWWYSILFTRETVLLDNVFSQHLYELPIHCVYLCDVSPVCSRSTMKDGKSLVAGSHMMYNCEVWQWYCWIFLMFVFHLSKIKFFWSRMGEYKMEMVSTATADCILLVVC